MAQRLSALRQYATGELEELTLVGLEALLLEISSEPRPTEAEDLLYISVTKPIRTHLRKRRRLEESKVAEVAVEVVLAEEAGAEEAAVEEAGDEEAAAPVQEEAAAPVPKFGLAKAGSEKPAPMGADAFQEHLSKGAEMAPCSDKRKSAVFKKKNPKGLSSSPSEKTPKKTKAAGTRHDDVGPATVAKRPAQYPNQSLQAKGGSLFCQACGIEVSTDNTGCARHCSGAHHVKALAKFASKVETNNKVKQLLTDYKSQEAEEEGLGISGMETVALDVQAHRLNVLETFLESGIPAYKINNSRLRSLLEAAGGPLTQACHLVNTYIGAVLYKELRLLKEEMGPDVLLGITTDATTESGEAFAITARWVERTTMKVPACLRVCVRVVLN